MESIKVKKGTTTVGIVCKDGVILGADKRATAGSLIVDKKSQKIFKITDKMAITMAGTVSDAQLLYKLIKAELKLKQFRTEREPSVKESANLLAGMIYSNIRKFSIIPGISHFLLAGADSEGIHLYDLFADGSITEIDDYVSTGSGSVMAYGVLEVMYRKELTLKEALPIAIKAINSAMSRDTYTGEGIDVVSVTGEGIKTLFEKMLETTIKV
ncbi:proteasome subunit beta [Candidatus Woesearchaeota archaeon]|nr:proteasome subunit beta [Candidatus Woesearchaeota archaeon]